VGTLRLSQLDAVIFDLDGTLVQLTIDFDQMRAAVLDIVARYGVAIDARQQGLLTLELIADVTAGMVRRSPKQAARFEAEANRAVEAIEVEAAHRADLFPGVPELLLWLRGHLHARGQLFLSYFAMYSAVRWGIEVLRRGYTAQPITQGAWLTQGQVASMVIFVFSLAGIWILARRQARIASHEQSHLRPQTRRARGRRTSG